MEAATACGMLVQAGRRDRNYNAQHACLPELAPRSNSSTARQVVGGTLPVEAVFGFGIYELENLVLAEASFFLLWLLLLLLLIY